MTIGEVSRAIESHNRVRKLEAQDKASYDYILARLIVKGVSITLGDKDNFPTIQESYPSLFDELIEAQQKKIQQQKDNLSALRFRQFAHSYNNRMKNKEVAKQVNE